MKSRERLQTALRHEEPDRVPLDLGGPATSLLFDTYENLKRYLGLKTPTRLRSRTWQTVEVEEDILKLLDIDTRYVFERGLKIEDEDKTTSFFVDEWGVTRTKIGYYYEITQFPLRDAKIEDLDTYPWPDALNPERIRGLREQAEHLLQETDYAVIGHCSGSIFEACWYLRGYDQFLIDLVANKDFAHALLRKITDIQKLRTTAFLREIGEYIDVVTYGDDLATHTGPAISPELYREMVKPYHQELYDLVHSLTKAKLWYHSCGDVYPLIGDLIDIGVDILNPIQVSTERMGDTGKLKKQFGRNICFWGAIDTQKIMPFGSIQDVREEVRRRVEDLAPGGGYVVAAVHNLCPDVPPENIYAMFQAAKEYGKYPVS